MSEIFENILTLGNSQCDDFKWVKCGKTERCAADGRAALWRLSGYATMRGSVRANILSPGLLATAIFMDVSTDAEREYYRDSIGIGEPEGVVPTLLYLISDASEYLTGVVIEQRIITARERTAH